MIPIIGVMVGFYILTRMLSFLSRTGGFLLLFLALSATAVTQDEEAPYGTIYLYRTRWNGGTAVESPVYCDGVPILRMDNGRFLGVRLPPGIHRLNSDKLDKVVRFNVESGKAYYAEVHMGLFGRSSIKVVSNDKGATSVSKLQPLASKFLSPALQKVSETEVALGLRVPDPRTTVTSCVEGTVTSGATYRVNSGDFPANPEKGETGSGFSNDSKYFLADFGSLKLDEQGSRANVRGMMSFRRDELVRVTEILEVPHPSIGPPDSVTIKLSSLLKHNVTRGKGAFEHQSPEFLNSILNVPLRMSCDVFRSVWTTFFLEAESTEVEEWLSRFPSGVLVEELREGMTVEEVEAIMGPPENRAVLGEKIVYFYPRMKITFLKGRLADVQ